MEIELNEMPNLHEISVVTSDDMSLEQLNTIQQTHQTVTTETEFDPDPQSFTKEDEQHPTTRHPITTLAPQDDKTELTQLLIKYYAHLQKNHANPIKSGSSHYRQYLRRHINPSEGTVQTGNPKRLTAPEQANHQVSIQTSNNLPDSIWEDQPPYTQWA